MAKYRFEQIAINSKEKKKPAEEVVVLAFLDHRGEDAVPAGGLDDGDVVGFLLLSPFLSHPGFSTGKIPPEIARIGLEWIESKSIF